MSDMATIELPYVQAFTDRHGKRRHYFRKRGFTRVCLPEPGSDGFLAAYENAGKRDKSEGVGAERTDPGTINALVVAYYLTGDYLSLRASTQRAHRNLLDRFRQEHGDKRVARIEPKHLEGIFQGMAKTPAQASNLRKRLRTLFDLAARFGWRADNPVRATKAPRYRAKGFTPWSEADIAAYQEKWPTGSRERLALALLLYTGQRRSDVVTMGRQHIKAGRIHVCQVKTDARLAIKLHPALQAEIDAAPMGMTLLLTGYGVPFSPAGFTAWFVARAVAAGLKGRSPHGLRKAAGRRLAEAGCSAHEIMAVLGHTSLAEAERYTKSADQTKMADAAVTRLGTEQ